MNLFPYASFLAMHVTCVTVSLAHCKYNVFSRIPRAFFFLGGGDNADQKLGRAAYSRTIIVDIAVLRYMTMCLLSLRTLTMCSRSFKVNERLRALKTRSTYFAHSGGQNVR
jgi:hypothetical protein